jgi:hypothetical protein
MDASFSQMHPEVNHHSQIANELPFAACTIQLMVKSAVGSIF